MSTMQRIKVPADRLAAVRQAMPFGIEYHVVFKG
jgi:hypothetical protein